MDNIINKKVNAETGDVLVFAAGAPGASASVDSIEAVTLPAGSEATVENLGTPHNVHLRLGIPKGVSGNETINDAAGEGDTDYVWSADKAEKVVNSSRVQEVMEPTYERGSISLSKGTNSSSTTIARSPDIIDFGRDVYKIIVTPTEGYIWGGRIYSKEDGTYLNGITNTGFDKTGTWIDSEEIIEVDPTMVYRFTLKRSDGAEIVIANLPDDVLTFTVWHATDKSLTEAGVPADAEITGQYIDVIASENLIWNTLNPSVTPAEKRPSLNGIRYVTGSSYTSFALIEHGIRAIATRNGNTPTIKFGSSTFSLNEGLHGLEPGAWYTITADVKSHLSGSGNTNFYIDTNNEAGTGWAEKTKTIFSNPTGGGEADSHFIYSFMIPANADHLCLQFHFNVAGTANVIAGDDYIEVSKLMLQKGKQGIPWKPNTHDYLTSKLLKWEDDPDMDVKVQQLARKTRISGSTFGTAPFVLAHFSDIHGDQKCLQNIVDFSKYYQNYVDDVLHTGDIVDNYASDGTTFWTNVEGSEKILNCIGNHDTRTTEAWIGLSMSDCYDAYYAPFIDNWGANAEEGKTYYYKDYTAKNVRLIVLDAMHQDENGEMQSWFADTLLAAKSAGLHVIAASHIKPYWDLVGYENTWDDYLSVPYPSDPSDRSSDSSYPGNLLSYYPQQVEEFIEDGGNFVCWLHGHLHYRRLYRSATYPRQLTVGVSNAGFHYANTSVWNRIEGTKSEDDFNVIGVDTYSKILRIAKVGVNYDRWMRHVDTLSYDYGNHQLIYAS